MKYFTRQWHSGELSDRAIEAAVTAYRAHIRSIASRLSPSLRFLAREISLHDGLIEKARVSSRSLTLRLRIGDRQRGYSSICLAYAGVRRTDRLHPSLRQLAISEDEVVSDEIDVSSQGFTHRLFFSNDVEVTVAFETLVVRLSPRKTRRLSIPAHLRVRREPHIAA